ncbi:hypothetical protein D210916BOD24_13950 [Alteromonas sp. D210916BOD_24]|uniref:MarR family winged helix-turn-helix transcriptional regulator n=1 Tax=Alteromonas sp. D210916BOD_24 TaxID=3157618 RepID=UPI00399C999C
MLDSAESSYLTLFTSVNNKVTKRLEGALNHHGVSFSEFMIMHYLYSSPYKTAKRMALAEQVGISASGVTRLLQPMEKNKLVAKEANPRDARVSLVKLTEAGERVYCESAVAFDFCAKDLLSNLTEVQLQKLSELSHKIL